MAHDLARIGGRIAMAYQGESPWHHLGTRMPAGTVTVADAMDAANLNWTVSLQPMYLAGPDGALGAMVPRWKSIVRDTDGVNLNCVGADYHVLQNTEAFEILNPACEAHGVTIESAGALGNGSEVWMLARMNRTVTVGAGDDVNGYFLVKTGHGGQRAYLAKFTPVRVVCRNTLDAAMTDGVDFFRLPHVKGMKDRVDNAKRMVERMLTAMEQTGETFNQMAAKKLTAEQVKDYIEAVVPEPNRLKPSVTLAERRATMAKLVWTGVGATLAGSDGNGTTAWAAYNAVTEYFDHVRPAEAKAAGAKLRANESALFGLNAGVKRHALELARELVAV
jgi:phage/plasmid-like protein (TIGR03299 family)